MSKVEGNIVDVLNRRIFPGQISLERGRIASVLETGQEVASSTRGGSHERAELRAGPQDAGKNNQNDPRNGKSPQPSAYAAFLHDPFGLSQPADKR